MAPEGRYQRVLVTGGLGFIGSSYVRLLLTETALEVVNLDLMTYAAHPETLQELTSDPRYAARYTFVKGDIADPAVVRRALEGCDAVVNFAAETHVDRSIHDAAPFVHTNVEGVRVLLDAVREAARERPVRFVHVSTDEVYGEVLEGLSREDDPFRPRSPYSASKAGGDLLVGAYGVTYGLDTVVTRGSNNYGTHQFPEKIIPLFITNALDDQPLPVYGTGKAIRDYIFVTDHVRGIHAALLRGRRGEAYNLGGQNQTDGLSVARTILDALGKPHTLIQHVQDRPGHDLRYALDITKATRELGWRPTVTFAEGIAQTVRWYQEHPDWWRPLKAAQAAFFTQQYAQRS
ncbi:dTDP-glucose 4,6-dehydratase [Truepera radiovictrix]|uniref:dTDP-glucose 4,6-dehydratase n=1 Tax=Truepera radiovictrix (strain DSM 17093 / CIP 108686 / LMG 22925 / RQ-24) TaxID=649638 RepID=D7CVQ7_TRURR|nr:dTDP-glucose 4,6-dehydratase [Truepera radiovictrix]ADI15968.1 dTDP-glucose 4,6-dehydratase [Truepera radiovictrix DSM 17093]WMT58407.1 dTDP-glucose 4,6-dehydratase [Truepera radiovictrix]